MSRKVSTKVSEIWLVYNSKVKAEGRPQIRYSQDAYWVLESNWSDQILLVEEFNILLLDRPNQVMAIQAISGSPHFISGRRLLFLCR